MAHPIFTFIYPKTQKRYYQLYDTVIGAPETVPMDLITFLQYKGLYNKENTGVIFAFFNQLLETGITLPYMNENIMENPAFYFSQTFEFLDNYENTVTSSEATLNNELEELFGQNIPFTVFYQQYLNLIQTINIHPDRQLNYYYYFSRTIDCLRKSNRLNLPVILDVLERNNITFDFFEKETDLYSFREWIEKGLLFSHKDVMAKLFVELAEKNLIAIDAIPHVLRDQQSVSALFQRFEMQNLLPNYQLPDNDGRINYELTEFGINTYILQYANLATFHPLGDQSLIGFSLLDKTFTEIQDKLMDLYIYAPLLVNFSNSNGQTLLPMIYTRYFSGEGNLCTLSPFNVQQFSVFSVNGILISDIGYWDNLKVNESITYYQHMNLFDWDRITFDDGSNIFTKTQIKDSSSFSETEDGDDLENKIRDIEADFLVQEETEEYLNKQFKKVSIIIEIPNNDDLPF